MGELWLNGISYSGGGGGTASDVEYDNTDSGLSADNVQDAIDEIKESISDDIISVLIDKGTLVPDSYVKTDGDFAAYGGWSRTGYIKKEKWITVKLNTSTNYGAFYDENYEFVARAQFTENTAIDVPKLAKYIAISSTTSAMSTLVITATMGGLEYNVKNEVKKVSDVVITNKVINPSGIINNAFIDGDGNQLESSDWVCTNYLDLPYDEVSDIIVHGTFYGIAGCAIYNENKTLILAINGSNVSTYGGQAGSRLQSIVIPYQRGMRYIRISASKSYYSELTDLYVSGNTLAGAFERIFNLDEEVKEISANISTTIANSKVLVIGDSISADAYGNYTKWVTDLKNEGFLPSDTLNSSQHATGFVARYNSQANDFITRLEAIDNPSQYDLVIVFGGINDYIQNIPMGSESGTDYDVSFKPAVNHFFDYLIQNFTQARLCVLLPLRNYQNWVNSEGHTQQEYGQYINTVAKKYCLPVLNLTEDSGFCPYISTFSDMWTFIPEGYQTGDGVHPNEEYERRFLAPMIKRFLQGLM